MITAYAPNARQEAFHRSTAEWRWYCAGYGAGKTRALTVECVRNAAITHPGFTGIVAAPTFPLLFQSWFAEWKKVVPREAWELKRDPYLGPHILVRTAAHSDSTIYLRSTNNPWSNEGINAAWLAFDEAPRERDREAFDVLVSRVRAGHVGRQLNVSIAGPPMTRRHWTAEEFGTGPDATHRGDHLSWSDGTRAVIRARTRDNTALDPSYEARLRSRAGATRAWCRQWLDAEFGSIEGQVYGAFDRGVHVIHAALLEGRQWRRVVVGTDWGFEHPGVMLVVAIDGSGDIFVLHEEVHQHKVVSNDSDGWGTIARDLASTWKARDFACDPSSPSNVRVVGRGVARVGGRAFGADNDVGNGLRRVLARLERAASRKRPETRTREHGLGGLWVSSACVHTIGEFESYARKRDRDGAFLEVPEEKNDDAMDALRYAVMELTKREVE